MKRVGIPALLTLFALSLLAGRAMSESWTVQTVALRDFQQANEVVESLGRLGYQAYTEFAMNRGLQYIRVRVGCFDTREGAERMARHLRGAVTSNAVAQPLSEEASVEECTEVTVGFFKPQSWSVVQSGREAIVFEVTVANRRAFVEHRGGAWNVTQFLALPADGRGDPTGPFVQANPEGRPLILMRRGDDTIAVCPGTLLWQSDEVAVVDDGDAILSCRPGTQP